MRDDQTDSGRKPGAKPLTREEKSTPFAHKQMIFTKSSDRNPPSLPGPQQ